MFGYVTFYKDELKIKDYNKFRAYYCGLCKELGSRFNQLVRFGLSYDFTFLSLLLDSLDESKTQFAYEGCLKHLGKKRATVKNNPSIRYGADMSVVFMYYKLLDDWRDDRSLKSALAMIPYWFAVRKVRGNYPHIVSKIQENLKKLCELEKEKCASLDMVAHTFAEIMETLFDCGGEDLKRLGYNIGRFIYIADALNDIEDDTRKHKYNPFICAYPQKSAEDIRKDIEPTLLFTLSMAGECFENLNIQKSKDILNNIIYMGLRQRMESVLGKKGNKNGKSL